MDVRDFADAMRRFWPLALAVLVAWNAIGVALVALRTPSYRATTTLIVEPSGGGGDFNSVEVVRFLLPSLAEQVRTPSFARELRKDLGPTLAAKAGNVSASIEAGTGILRITAESRDADAAVAAANAAARILIDRKLSEFIDIRILSRAGQPALPSTLPVLFSSTALGLILGIAAAVVANALRPRFKGAEEIEDRLGLAVLGEIPALGRRMPKPLELFNGSRNWQMAKAYQRLGVNLEIALPSKSASAVAVTSFGRGEGKTTVTANLAWAVALLRQTVVGIDGDLHEPALHEYFDLQPTNGAGYPPQPTPTGNPWLTIVPASRSDRDATAVLTSELPRVLGAFRDRLVFVDTPAITDRADATLIASMAKAALLVVDIRSRHPAEVERAIHDLRRVGVEVLGIVVNRSRAPFPR